MPKISELPAATNLTESDLFHVVQDGTNKQAPKSLVQSVYNVKAYGAKGDGSTDDTSAIQSAIDAANAAGGGDVYFPGSENTYVVASGVTLKEGVTLRLSQAAVIEHTATSGVCVTVTAKSHIIGGMFLHDMGGSYGGTLIKTDNTVFDRYEPSVKIHTTMQGANASVGTGLHILSDGGVQNASKQFMDVDVVCGVLAVGLKLEVLNATGNNSFINGNNIKAKFTNCDQCVYLKGQTLASGGKIAGNTFQFIIQASTNTTELIRMEACFNNHFFLTVFDWGPASGNDNGGINHHDGDEKNQFNAFYGNIDYRYFRAFVGGADQYGDIGLGGSFNHLAQSYQSGFLFRADSTETDTSVKYLPAFKQEGMMWYDDNDNTVKYYNGTIRTISST